MLVQLTTLKARLGLDSFDTKDDTILTDLIKHASGRFEVETNRKFDYAAAATFHFSANYMMVIPNRCPIYSVASFALKQTEAIGYVDVSNVDYLIGAKRASLDLAAPLGSSREVGRVTYAGGYMLPGGSAGGDALPDEIEQACSDQAAYWYQRRQQLGIVTMTTQGGSISQLPSLDLLPHVVEVLKNYERWLN